MNIMRADRRARQRVKTTQNRVPLSISDVTMPAIAMMDMPETNVKYVSQPIHRTVSN